MDREQLSLIAHREHPIKSPLGDDSVQRLLERSLSPGTRRVLDLGCGTGEWLLRALTTRADVLADGVDISPGALAQAARAAEARGVRDRLRLHQSKAEDFAGAEPFDVVLSVGAAHAFGGLLPTLAAARRHLAPGGRVLVSDGFWQHPPSNEAVEMLGEFDDLATTVDKVVADGWTPIDGHVSTRQELDDYEWSTCGTLATWALEHPDDPDSATVLTTANQRRAEWLHTYRDTFGFLSLVLRRAD
ncbi:class I SAM-dependent methyltransferase [Kribbella hippodromi]|uniref:Class I SAM-dependent methyltransferase n=1 Tax=Kribbella hippodromi TaxID=434347 RepID=A0ABN2EF49_9ACTN